MRLNLYKYLVVLCLVGCGAPSPKSPSPGEPLSELQQKLLDLGAKAFKKLQDSDLFEGDIASNDPVALAKDLQTRASAILTERHVQRLDAFIQELKNDNASQDNLIALKNFYLKPDFKATVADPIWLAGLLEKIAYDDTHLKLILDIRDDLFRDDGKLLKKILLDASSDPVRKAAFLAGEKYEKSQKEAFEIYNNCIKTTLNTEHCVDNYQNSFPFGLFTEAGNHYLHFLTRGRFGYQSDLIKFSKTPLKENLDLLEKLTGAKNAVGEDEVKWTAMKLIKIVDYQSLDWLFKYIEDIDQQTLKKRLLDFAKNLRNSKNENFKKLLVNLHPELREAGELILEHYTGKSLAKLDQKTFQTLLEKTSLILRDQEYGPIWYIRTYINPN